MSIYGTSQADAQRIADALAGLVGKHARFTENGYCRTVTGYVVSRYTGTADYGITERWTYDGRPDLPEMGGGFINLNLARTLARK
jgi:hypothetical protein